MKKTWIHICEPLNEMDYPYRRPFVVKRTQHHQRFRNMVLLGGHDRHMLARYEMKQHTQLAYDASPNSSSCCKVCRSIKRNLTTKWAKYDLGSHCIMVGRIKRWKVLYFVRIGPYLCSLFVCCTTSLGKWHLRKQHDTRGQEVFLVVGRSIFLNVAFFK